MAVMYEIIHNVLNNEYIITDEIFLKIYILNVKHSVKDDYMFIFPYYLVAPARNFILDYNNFLIMISECYKPWIDNLLITTVIKKGYNFRAWKW